MIEAKHGGQMEIASQKTIELLTAGGAVPATDEQLSRFRVTGKNRLPEDYMSFVAAFGFPFWPDDAAGRFTHRHDLDSRWVALEDSLGGFISPEKMKYTADELASALPKLSPRLEKAMPLAGTYDGHSVLILELAPNVGRIWHWSEASQWVDFDGTTLGLIADSFSKFVNELVQIDE